MDPFLIDRRLLAFLREADLMRYKRELEIDSSHDRNPYSQSILKKLDSSEYVAWVADSWRQYLFWFADCESHIDSDSGAASVIVANAVSKWCDVRAIGLMFEEERNNGDWVRAWDIVLNELNRRPD